MNVYDIPKTVFSRLSGVCFGEDSTWFARDCASVCARARDVGVETFLRYRSDRSVAVLDLFRTREECGEYNNRGIVSVVASWEPGEACVSFGEDVSAYGFLGTGYRADDLALAGIVLEIQRMVLELMRERVCSKAVSAIGGSKNYSEGLTGGIYEVD